MSDAKPDLNSDKPMTVDDAIELARSYNAGVVKLIPRDEDDNVMGACRRCVGGMAERGLRTASWLDASGASGFAEHLLNGCDTLNIC